MSIAERLFKKMYGKESFEYYKRAAKFRICHQCITENHGDCNGLCVTKTTTECSCAKNNHILPPEFMANEVENEQG